MNNKIIFNYKGEEYEFPVIEGTEGEKAIDIKDLRSRTGLTALDYGFKNTSSTQSEITFLDGEKGILRYRGYPIEELAEKKSFLEISYLLVYGKLPTEKEFKIFEERIKDHSFVNEKLIKIIDGFPSDSHPMGVLSASVSALTAFHLTEEEQNDDLDIIKLIAKLPNLISLSYRKSKGLPINYPNKNLDYVEDFWSMMFSMPNQEFKMDDSIRDILNLLLIVHVDHEQNCSTSTVRIVGSSDASLYASVSSGISALWGPLHGGANQAVIEMLEKIRTEGGDIEKWINRAKDKNDDFRLMGFGHRVYKNFDPRSNIIKKNVGIILDNLGIEDPALEIAKKLEEVALSDEYFIKRKLYPNVDFYSGIIYKALGIPTNMFTVMFTLGRLPGWIAQWKEMKKNREPIGRPRQLYIGEKKRSV